MSDTRYDVVVGRLPALACLNASKRAVHKAYLHNGAKGLEEIIGCLSPDQIRWCDKRELDKIAGGVVHQGVALYASPLPIMALQDWLLMHPEKSCALVILDSIADPMNFGAIIRSAAAFGAAGVLFQKDRAAPVSPATVKASAGGVEYVDLIQATNLVRDIQLLKKENFWVTTLEASGDQLLWQADFKGRTAIIIGSEGNGVRRLVKEQSDFIVSIPIRGELSSLNASVAAGLALGEWLRQSHQENSCNP